MWPTGRPLVLFTKRNSLDRAECDLLGERVVPGRGTQRQLRESPSKKNLGLLAIQKSNPNPASHGSLRPRKLTTDLGLSGHPDQRNSSNLRHGVVMKKIKILRIVPLKTLVIATLILNLSAPAFCEVMLEGVWTTPFNQKPKLRENLHEFRSDGAYFVWEVSRPQHKFLPGQKRINLLPKLAIVPNPSTPGMTNQQDWSMEGEELRISQNFFILIERGKYFIRLEATEKCFPVVKDAKRCRIEKKGNPILWADKEWGMKKSSQEERAILESPRKAEALMFWAMDHKQMDSVSTQLGISQTRGFKALLKDNPLFSDDYILGPELLKKSFGMALGNGYLEPFESLLDHGYGKWLRYHPNPTFESYEKQFSRISKLFPKDQARFRKIKDLMSVHLGGDNVSPIAPWDGTSLVIDNSSKKPKNLDFFALDRNAFPLFAVTNNIIESRGFSKPIKNIEELLLGSWLHQDDKHIIGSIEFLDNSYALVNSTIMRYSNNDYGQGNGLALVKWRQEFSGTIEDDNFLKQYGDYFSSIVFEFISQMDSRYRSKKFLAKTKKIQYFNKEYRLAIVVGTDKIYIAPLKARERPKFSSLLKFDVVLKNKPDQVFDWEPTRRNHIKSSHWRLNKICEEWEKESLKHPECDKFLTRMVSLDSGGKSLDTRPSQPKPNRGGKKIENNVRDKVQRVEQEVNVTGIDKEGLLPSTSTPTKRTPPKKAPGLLKGPNPSKNVVSKAPPSAPIILIPDISGDWRVFFLGTEAGGVNVEQDNWELKFLSPGRPPARGKLAPSGIVHGIDWKITGKIEKNGKKVSWSNGVTWLRK